MIFVLLFHILFVVAEYRYFIYLNAVRSLNILARIMPSSIIREFTAYKFTVVEFDCARDKRSMDVMHIAKNLSPRDHQPSTSFHSSIQQVASIFKIKPFLTYAIVNRTMGWIASYCHHEHAIANCSDRKGKD